MVISFFKRAVWAGLLFVAGCAHTEPTPAATTVYGFFPSPARIEMDSVVATLQGMAQHGDVALFQEHVPWEELLAGPDAPSTQVEDLKNFVHLAQSYGLGAIFVVDPLNGLDRTEFYGVPEAWGPPSFGDARVRAAYKNFALRIAREFHPHFLGLGSEVNTYLATHPDDADNFLSLYRETYDALKAEFPNMRVFVTFQWDQLVRPDAFPGVSDPSRTPQEVIRAFEPRLDVWAISSYPCFLYPDGAVPDDYYAPLASMTGKPLAVAEGGCSSRSVGGFPGKVENQIAYLEALERQLEGRLSFWIYLLYNDLDVDAYRAYMEDHGAAEDVATLELFAYMGLADAEGQPKASMAAWDRLRAKH